MNTPNNLEDILGKIDNQISKKLREQQDRSETSTSQNETELTSIGKHICFHIADSLIAIPLDFVREAGDVQFVHPLPFVPNWLEGITNIRGEIVSVINLANFLHINAPQPVPGQKFIVIHYDEITTSILVDRIMGTRQLYEKKNQFSNEQSRLTPDQFTTKALYLQDTIEREIDLLNIDNFLPATKISFSNEEA